MFLADRALSQQDLDEGVPFNLVGELFGEDLDNSGAVQRELLEIEQVEGVMTIVDGEWVGVDAWRVTVRERREGRFVVEGNRIEVLWECNRGHESGRFEITRNALAPNTIGIEFLGRFNRVE
jgi:hypothetical protein